MRNNGLYNRLHDPMDRNYHCNLCLCQKISIQQRGREKSLPLFYLGGIYDSNFRSGNRRFQKGNY